jgi:polyhydroxybutyrate depolymerase
MRRWTKALAIVTLGIAAASDGGATETIQIAVDGQPRTYLLEQAKARGPGPTIIMLHGANGTSERVAQQTGLLQLAPAGGVSAVFPQARGPVWNRFPSGKESQRAVETFSRFGGVPNDIGFIKLLVADLTRRGVADPARIFVAGLSNGGFMTLSLFCYEGDLFAGIGLIISSMPDETGAECRSAKPLPVVILNGTADTTVPYRGGPVAPLDPRDTRSTFNVWSTRRMVTFFRGLNGCEEPAEQAVAPGPGAVKIEIDRSNKCAGGPVVAHNVVGGTHGSTLAALHPGRMLMDFFRDRRR